VRPFLASSHFLTHSLHRQKKRRHSIELEGKALSEVSATTVFSADMARKRKLKRKQEDENEGGSSAE